MIIIMGKFEIDPARIEALRPVIGETVRHTLNEEGCHAYSLTVEDEGGADRPAVLRVSERWELDAHLQSHGGTAHIAQFRAALAGAVRGRDLKVFDVTGERSL